MISKSECFQFFQIWQSQIIERISEVFRRVGLGDEFYSDFVKDGNRNAL
jgi:hypothetical protein